MMIRRSTGRRPGLSLMEVLVGFGIVGIAVPAVLTLFPFSALTLGDALKNDRTVTCAVTADGILRDVHRDVVEQSNIGVPAQFLEPYFQQLDAPVVAPGTAGGSTQTTIPPGQDEPSTPVIIDPMGAYARRQFMKPSPPNTFQEFGDRDANGNGATLLPRVTFNSTLQLPSPQDQNLALRLCAQMDGLSFSESGNVPWSATMSEVRYNWMWVVQRPVNRDRFNLRMQVVVYNGRAHMYAPVGSEATFAPVTSISNVTTGVVFTPGETSILNVPATAEIRKGSWVMDATFRQQTVKDVPAPNPNLPLSVLRHAEFYRVLSVSDAVNGSVSLEVHKPIVRADGLSDPVTPSNFQYVGTLVVLPLVTDVYERPRLTGATGP